MSATEVVHVRIEGHVQGVGYRAWTEARARDLGLTGWVRNRRDGAVEAVFDGAAADVEAMLEACASGPLDAQVSRVEVIGRSGGAYDRFEVRATV